MFGSMIWMSRRVAQKYWAPGRLQIVAVGDATKITEILKKKGELEVYDADGNPKNSR